MIQIPLLFEVAAEPEVQTIASPICCAYYLPCKRAGRAVLGELRDLGGCVNSAIKCLTCGATGDESRNKELMETAS